MKSADNKKKEKENVHKDHRKRMRKRFASTGFGGWAKHEVLEFLLYNVFSQQDTNELAHRMLNQSGKRLAKVFENAQTDCLKEIKGVGDSTLLFLRTLKEFVSYYHSETLTESEVQITGKNFMDIISSVDFPKDTEDILMFCLDDFLRIKFITRITDFADGGSASTKPEKIIRAAAASGAKKVILVHNHPSGVLEPSFHDVRMTEQVDMMLRAIGSYLVDHYIIAGERIVGIKVVMQELASSAADLDEN